MEDKKIIEKVKEEMCDGYCKYPEMIEEDEDEIADVCANCPLNRLG